MRKKFFPVTLVSILLAVACQSETDESHTKLLSSLSGENRSSRFESSNLLLQSLEGSQPVQRIKVLTHNLYFLPSAISNWAQSTRAGYIAQADYIKNQDVIVFEETFDTNARAILLSGIQSQYPYQTDVIGRTTEGWDATLGNYRPASITNGGVTIVSKWPIEEKIQFIYDAGCGSDWFSNKGFAYVRLNVNGARVHVIGTHAQAADSACSDKGVSVRRNQFDNIRSFVQSKGIPSDELLLIAGDLNVIKGTTEYQDMIGRLGVNEPKYAGVQNSWDTKSNRIASFNYPNDPAEYLDYVFVSSDHGQPALWQNLAYDPISAKNWSAGGYTGYEYSDHFPVYGFVYANVNTPTASAHKRSYDNVSFTSVATGKKIQADPSTSNGWLKVSAASESPFTRFNLLRESDPDSNPSCLTSGVIRIEPANYFNYFWNWWLGGGGGNYAYYPKSNDGSDRLEILNLDGGCLQDGSRVAFKDYDTFWRKYHYLTVWDGGSWNEYLYLWMKSIGNRETFILHLDSEPPKNWAADLIYE
ncbi:sphingomyelin phosphodiesterase [Leptospira perolatii]|uniref:Sphingomyelin phosphodiesterase n=1 Tax=Leptospira perolatii TaxID=2023191 RepID=A0A2M9ZRE8_9LEPT|nr:sphingomyelin phosphodiesterase [Leptospira perolatii]PJZ71007.1 sphingomyelin phosphodiesterase [Leptospira perolatii]PJZ74539.1 sphingomyelin phosphodiesterase [Leptospira perolatii]